MLACAILVSSAIRSGTGGTGAPAILEVVVMVPLVLVSLGDVVSQLAVLKVQAQVAAQVPSQYFHRCRSGYPGGKPTLDDSGGIYAPK
ncbi:hypothetical protein RvY_17021 [Ramazzottius varieornatus]|uniref:Uncharacterized protein n=1 Tax=Ramazzottius varieornatus TaxID=947166 RepID=A0A1D1W1J9_RAMVA|nr:hypothetical protein RvY_17021 [Ramazzottius varieornatus]